MLHIIKVLECMDNLIVFFFLFFLEIYPFISYKTILLTVVNWEQKLYSPVITKLSLVPRSRASLIAYARLLLIPLSSLTESPRYTITTLIILHLKLWTCSQSCIKTLEVEKSIMEVGNTIQEFH